MYLEDEFTETCDVHLRNVELFLVRLFKDVSHRGVIRDVLEWYSKKGGAEVLIFVIGATRGNE